MPKGPWEEKIQARSSMPTRRCDAVAQRLHVFDPTLVPADRLNCRHGGQPGKRGQNALGARRVQAEPGKAAGLLILHVFVQTRAFGTVHRMLDGLSGEGYAVLAPTLTPGAPNRQRSLPCETIHKHRLTDAHAELNAWHAWLEKRHHGPVVLVGHSFGSAMLASYLQARKPPRVRKGRSARPSRADGAQGARSAATET